MVLRDSITWLECVLIFIPSEAGIYAKVFRVFNKISLSLRGQAYFLFLLFRVYERCLLTSFVISNIETFAFPKTAFLVLNRRPSGQCPSLRHISVKKTAGYA